MAEAPQTLNRERLTLNLTILSARFPSPRRNEGMKLTFIKMIFGIALITVAVQAGVSIHKAMERHAIKKVLQARQDIREHCITLVRINGQNVRKFEPGRTLYKLKHIDTSGCPTAFQVAWLGYLRSLRQFATPSPAERMEKQILTRPTLFSVEGNADGHIGLENGFGGGLGLHYEVAHENNARLAELYAKEDPAEALKHMESVAADFKVNALNYE
jgi:hypothetical protein